MNIFLILENNLITLDENNLTFELLNKELNKSINA